MKDTHPVEGATEAPEPASEFSAASSAPKTRAVIALLVVTAFSGSILGTWLQEKAFASRNSSGVYSLPAGNPVVTGTTITSSWANGTLPDIGTELTNSLDRNGRGAMNASLQLSSGVAGAPGVAFSAETNSGLYRNASKDIRFAINGVDTVKLNGNSSQPALAATGQAASSIGVSGTGAAGAAGATFSNGTAATATTAQDAVTLPNAYLSVDGASNPNSNVGFKNRVTPKNIIKAWVSLTTGATPTINDGFNISSASCASNNITVNLVQAMASSTYSVLCAIDGVSSTNIVVNTFSKSTSSFQIGGTLAASNTQAGLCNTGQAYSCIVLGAQ